MKNIAFQERPSTNFGTWFLIGIARLAECPFGVFFEVYERLFAILPHGVQPDIEGPLEISSSPWTVWPC